LEILLAMILNTTVAELITQSYLPKHVTMNRQRLKVKIELTTQASL